MNETIKELLEERLLRSNDFAIFTLGNGMRGIKLMEEDERRLEASKEIVRLKKEIEILQKRNEDLYKIVKESDQWE